MKLRNSIFTFLIVSSCVVDSNLNQHSEKDRIENHLEKITKTNGYRNYKNPQILNDVAGYLYEVFVEYCDSVYYQPYIVNGVEYKNVIGCFGLDKNERIVIGAHYDVFGDQEGADDNASGVAGLLELARMLRNQNTKYRIDLVAYTLEEPPFFRTNKMGSFIHAKSLHDSAVSLRGMICLEMIGYFSDTAKSQNYPLPHKKIIYGDKGNYIMIVQKFGNGTFGQEIKRRMKNTELIETKSIKSPSIIPGIDFSDHMNYWKFGYSAIMITNTSFYRNENYHQKSDKMETLDLDKMKAVIDEVYYAVTTIE